HVRASTAAQPIFTRALRVPRCAGRFDRPEARENRQRIGALAAERLPEGRGVACPNVARGRRPARCRSRARGGVRQVRAPRARCGHARCSDGRHMLTLPLSMMRRRVGGLVRATVLSLLVLAPPYVAAEIAPLYLRWD